MFTANITPSVTEIAGGKLRLRGKDAPSSVVSDRVAPVNGPDRNNGSVTMTSDCGRLSGETKFAGKCACHWLPGNYYLEGIAAESPRDWFWITIGHNDCDDIVTVRRNYLAVPDDPDPVDGYNFVAVYRASTSPRKFERREFAAFIDAAIWACQMLPTGPTPMPDETKTFIALMGPR